MPGKLSRTVGTGGGWPFLSHRLSNTYPGFWTQASMPRLNSVQGVKSLFVSVFSAKMVMGRE